ncbi:serine/threonine-protein kinase [Streptomyces sp. NPDC048172]|uniref:serine/threonine-protein kinase n=1 Tax=Streptomyces sp. NPDC048172 TaxID=3365505 RepID=UPI0037200573
MIAHRYRLERPLGRGGMGVVWEALDTSLDRKVAVKGLLHPGLRPDAAPDTRAQWVSRARREAQAIARIEHQNVVAVHDVIEDGEQVWIVMELLSSRSLADLLTEQRQLAVPHAARIGLQVLRGLIAVHQAGVVHRDVKPHNILFRPDGRALLMDFGIATFEGAVQVTRTHEIIGTAQYLAPELLVRSSDGPHAATPASDLWALGVTLYEMVEGRRPFEGMADLEVLISVSESPVPAMRYAGPLAPLIEALLTKDPARRPDAAEAERMLQAVKADSPEPDSPGPDAPADRRGADRWKVPVAVLCTALLATGAWFVWGQPDGSGAADTPASDKAGEARKAREAAKNGQGEKGTLLVGVKSDQPGLSVQKGKNFEGFEPGLARRIGEDMGYEKVEFVPVTTSHRARMLRQGEVDVVIATYSINDKRSKREGVEFVGPYYVDSMGILLKNSKFTKPSQIKNSPTSEVCTARNSTYDKEWFRANGYTPQKHLPDSYEACVKDLEDTSTNMDAVATDYVIVKGYESEHPGWKAFREEGDSQRYGVAVKASSDEKTRRLKKGVCRALSRIMRESGGTSGYEQLYDRHLKPILGPSTRRAPALDACEGLL